MSFKQKVYAHYVQMLDDKVKSLELILKELSESASNNTKSSAGDKHETARAMIQIEQETIDKQLNEALNQRSQLAKIDIAIHSSHIIKGSLVGTNKGYLFLSIAIGKIAVEGKEVMAISPQSPLGVKLMGLSVNDSAVINGANYFIKSIY